MYTNTHPKNKKPKTAEEIELKERTKGFEQKTI
jgi:hypothetical protein